MAGFGGLLGVFALLAFLFLDAGSEAVFGPMGPSGAERMIVYPVMIWLLAPGGYLMAGARSAGDQGERPA